MTKFINILIFICLCNSIFAKDNPYHFNNTFTIMVSDKLELRKDGDFYNKLLSDNGFEVNTNSVIVFQQKGLSDIAKKSFDTYCRILIQVIDCDDDCYTADCTSFSTEDYDFFYQAAYNNLAPQQKMVKKPEISVLRQNGYNYVKVSYTRTGKYGNVEGTMYYLFNLKKAVIMTTCYNIPDAHIWKNVVENAFKSFRWDKIFKEETTTYYDQSSTYSNNTNNSYSNNYDNNSVNYSRTRNDKSGVVGLLVILMMIVIGITIAVVKSTDNKQSTPEPSSKHTFAPPVIKTPERPTIKTTTVAAPVTKDLDNNKPQLVNYSISGTFANDYYAITKIPSKGTIVYPHRNHKAQRRGYMEESFERKLKQSLPLDCNYQVLGDVILCTAFSIRPYEPDIAIVEKNYNKGLRIDIEIDEPYSAIDRKPIHYIGCGDDYRDRVFNHFGWLVIRFSERQVFLEPDECISYIQRIMSVADDSFIRNVPMAEPTPEKRWTETEANVMIAEKFRENLLNHNFGSTDDETITNKTFRLTLQEIAAQKLVKEIDLPKEHTKNIDGTADSFQYDSKLVFEPMEHLYKYGNQLLTPVSNIVAMFFNEFDSLGMSARKSSNLREQIELIETWECSGSMAREVGTQLHLAIENYFNNRQMPDNYHFKFSGRYVKKDETISIKKEIGHFKKFVSDHPSLVPFRTEWRICDLQYGIAGSIDFISRNGGNFDIYDWKRSKKASPDAPSYNKHGRNGLSHLPDTSFCHYALQQNLYRYILEHNYGIKVGKMHIVVLHPDFANYKVHEIPRMDNEINTMLNYLKANQL